MRQVHYKVPTVYRHQKGVTLIEVLVSMLLMAIIGLGAAYISGRTAVMHRDQNIHLFTVNQMRQYLESSTGGCPAANPDGSRNVMVAGMKVVVKCTEKSKTYTVSPKDDSNTENNGIADLDVDVNYQTLSIVVPTEVSKLAADTLVPTIPIEISP